MDYIRRDVHHIVCIVYDHRVGMVMRDSDREGRERGGRGEREHPTGSVVHMYSVE